jgi:hypothetical protein
LANQYGLTEISDEARNSILEHYKAGIGIDTMVKQGLSPYGHALTTRIIKESKVPRMPVGNQVKYKPKCPDNKVCPSCGEEKPKEAFGSHAWNKDGLRSQCKVCRTEQERPGQLKRKYGITPEQYDKMYQDQKGLCACCGQPETAIHWKGRKRTLAVDHDHVTGQVRQLICHRCNVVIGLTKENPDLCELLRSYILKHKERQG